MHTELAVQNKTAKPSLSCGASLFNFKSQRSSALTTRLFRRFCVGMTEQKYSSKQSPPNQMENSRKQCVPDPETATSQSQGHISLAPSPSRSNHSSGELKPPTLQARLAEDSPARSSVSSGRSSVSHGSSPSRIAGEEKVLESPPKNPSGKCPDKQAPPVPVVSRLVRDEQPVLSKTADPVSRGGRVEEGGGGTGRRFRPSLSILRRTEREQMVKKAALGFRVFGFMFSLVSLSVMAADRNQGWALDSFYRYKEFRYCMSVNVIASVYSGAQAFDLGHQLATGKSIVLLPPRNYLDFAIDQMVAYLLISASSSATTRIDDWKSNWGSDKFPDMASAAVSMSFLAFAALAFSSLISGYALFTSKST